MFIVDFRIIIKKNVKWAQNVLNMTTVKLYKDLFNANITYINAFSLQFFI